MGKRQKATDTFMAPTGIRSWLEGIPLGDASLNHEKITLEEAAAIKWPDHDKEIKDWFVGIGKILKDPTIAQGLTRKRALDQVSESCTDPRWTTETEKRDGISMLVEMTTREMGQLIDYLHPENPEASEVFPERLNMTPAKAKKDLLVACVEADYILATLQEMLRVAPSWEGQQFLRGVIDSLVRDTQGVTDFIRTYYKG